MFNYEKSAASTRMYAKAIKSLRKRKIKWLTDDIYVMLCTDGYTPDFTNDKTLADVTSEVRGIGYHPGGRALFSKTVSSDRHNPGCLNAVTLEAADVEWPLTTITASRAVVYKRTGKRETSRLIGCVIFGAMISTAAGQFRLRWPATGMFTFFEPVD